ncbi:fumarylacetoacetate hydrolase family protein [Bryobacter aggregatus]|uniref:fumarylacetoacetate hydrolase family protein n=1 Tax=Bryobacter aggregatus TaxID=360054 RepID=UPI00055DBCA0|nr:fumarylacetoacetate hydrolase family protein [Bryobacter aggregatus]
MTRRNSLAAVAFAAAAAPAAIERYIRYQHAGRISWGRLEGEQITPLSNAPYLNGRPLGSKKALREVKLLAPADPSKVFAVGLNYKSHIGNRTAPREPEIFYKPTTCLVASGEPIVIPAGAKNVHYEGELVLVLAKGGRNLNLAQASAAIFGATCGNDVSERDWQNGKDKDLQWWRAKGSDSFGPLGPMLVRGSDYQKALLQTRLNGEVVQKQLTSDLLFDCPTIVSFISKYVTLEAGDVIFTGTPGATRKMSPGDTVEVEIDGIGRLRNPVQGA